MTDYSQAGEQALILKALEHYDHEANKARFLEIGGWHPEQLSNTRALYELGWSGVIIEPSPRPMQSFLDAYGFDERITLIQAAVAMETGLMPMYVTDDALSTSSEDEYQRWKDAAKFRGKMLVPTITLEQIGNQFGGFDFVSIDAEGTSADLCLKLWSLGQFPPVICCEHDGRTTELMATGSSHGYTMKGNDTNLVMWR